MSKELTIDNISQRTRDVVQFYVLHPDYTHEEVGKQFGLSRGRITHILNNERIKRLFPILAKRHLGSAGVLKASQAYMQLIEQNRDLSVKEKASKTVLTSNGVLSNDKTNVQVNVDGEIRLKSVQELAKIIQKAKDLPQIVIEAELSDEQVS